MNVSGCDLSFDQAVCAAVNYYEFMNHNCMSSYNYNSSILFVASFATACGIVKVIADCWLLAGIQEEEEAWINVQEKKEKFDVSRFNKGLVVFSGALIVLAGLMQYLATGSKSFPAWIVNDWNLAVRTCTA